MTYGELLAAMQADGTYEGYVRKLTRDASRGIHAAQAELVTYTLHYAERPELEVEMLASAEVAAALAAEHGKAEDATCLSGILMKRMGHVLAGMIAENATNTRAEGYLAEAFLTLEPLFEGGNREPLLMAVSMADEHGVGSGEDRFAVIFDNAIAKLKPSTAQAVAKHIKSLRAGGKR